jgi:hypothetical protein
MNAHSRSPKPPCTPEPPDLDPDTPTNTSKLLYDYERFSVLALQRNLPFQLPPFYVSFSRPRINDTSANGYPKVIKKTAVYSSLSSVFFYVCATRHGRYEYNTIRARERRIRWAENPGGQIAPEMFVFLIYLIFFDGEYGGASEGRGPEMEGLRFLAFVFLFDRKERAWRIDRHFYRNLLVHHHCGIPCRFLTRRNVMCCYSYSLYAHDSFTYSGGGSSSPPSTQTFASSSSISSFLAFHSSTCSNLSLSSWSSRSTFIFSFSVPMRSNSHSWSSDSVRPMVKLKVWYFFSEARVEIVINAACVRISCFGGGRDQRAY